MSPPDGYSDWDFAARNLRSRALAAQARRRRLQRLVHVPDPDARSLRRDRAVACRCSSSGTTPSSALRAKEAGYPTVTFPGAAVWHVPWTDKNDALDWQAYFHQRNRFVAALLHSPYPHGGRMIRESFNHQIKHLVSMQYSTVELRHQALEDVLAGPEQLHDDLPTKLGEVREFAQAVHRRPARGRPRRLPAGPPRQAAAQGQGRHGDPGPALPAASPPALGADAPAPRHPRRSRGEFPEAELCRRWTPTGSAWPRYDSAVVCMHDGTSAALYQRDPDQFRDLLRRTIEIHERLYREWPRLAAALPRRSSARSPRPQRWEKTFAASTEEQPMRAAEQARSEADGRRARRRRKNAAGARGGWPSNQADAMPVVEAADGPRQERVVDAELVAAGARAAASSRCSSSPTCCG